MENLSGKKVPTCVFISGNGSNLKSIIDSSRDYSFPATIKLVISNKKNAKGLDHARKYNIPFKFFYYKNKTYFENKCLAELKKRKIKLLCMAGFMKILSKNFIKRFKGKILNIHPSLLPKYKGLNTHQRAISNNEKYSGCTVHFVNSRLDSGKIILQKKVKISKFDTAKSLANKILIQEHKLYPKGIRKVFSL